MENIDRLIANAKKAQEEVSNYSQEQINEVSIAVGWQLYKDDNISLLAKMAAEETGYGNVASKIQKHKRKVGGTLQDILEKDAVSVGRIETIESKGITKYAKPVGVVCAILPATNPTVTTGTNGISILKGRNAVIFRPSSRSVKASAKAIAFMRQGLRKINAPENLVQICSNASREETAYLMNQCDMVVATGGTPMVRAAYSSGTPAYGVGVGNANCIIAEDADVEDAISKVASSKVFDYATSCSSENSIIVHESVYEKAIDALVRHKAHICTPEEREILKGYMWKLNKNNKLALNPEIIAKSATSIAGNAGLQVPDDTQILAVIGTQNAWDDQFSREKISPVLTVYKYKRFDKALEMLSKIAEACGKGHSMGIHTFNRDYIRIMGETALTSRITVRAPMSAANGGYAFNGLPSTATLGCGTWGKNSTTENVNWRHFINVTWVAEPTPEKVFDEKAVFGAFFEKNGK